MRRRSLYTVSVQHGDSVMMYTARAVSRSQATQYAILKYPRATYIHVSGLVLGGI